MAEDRRLLVMRKVYRACIVNASVFFEQLNSIKDVLLAVVFKGQVQYRPIG